MQTRHWIVLTGVLIAGLGMVAVPVVSRCVSSATASNGLNADDHRQIQKVIDESKRIKIKTIIDIELIRPGEVEVATGEGTGLLDGGGYDVQMIKSNGVWQITEITGWVS